MLQGDWSDVKKFAEHSGFREHGRSEPPVIFFADMQCVFAADLAHEVHVVVLVADE